MDQSYLCIPLIDESNAVHGVAEVFNSRHDAKVITSWLSNSVPSAYARCGSLHVFRHFVGKLIKAFLERSAKGDSYVRITDKAPVKSPRSKRMLKRTDSPSVFPPPLPARASGPMSAYSIESLLEFLQQAVAAEACIVYAYDDESHLLWSRFTNEDAGDDWWPATVKYGTGVIGETASKRKFAQFSRQVLSAIAPQSGASSKIRSQDVDDVLCIPIFDCENHVNGVVLLYKGDQVEFTEADVTVSTSVCRHVGPALHSSAQQEAILKAQDKAQTLLELSAVVFRELETNSLLLAIMKAIKKPMNATRCSMFIMDDETNELYSPLGSDISCDLAAGDACRISVDAGIIGAAVQSGEIINVRDAYLDPRFNPDMDQKTGFVTRSILAVPIKDVNGKILGALEVVNKEPPASRGALSSSMIRVAGKQYFDSDDEELARGIAYYIAIALNNARLFAEARIAKRRSDALLAMMQAISSSNENVGDVFKSIVDKTCQILHVEHGALFFVDTLNNTLFCRVGLNWRGFSMPVGKYIQGIVAERGEIINLGKAASHPDFNREYDEIAGIKTHNLLCVPVKASSTGKHGVAGDHVVAVFYVANKIGKSQRARFCAEDIKIMRAICGELSSVIERRAWELVFEKGDGNERATHQFLSQYTTTPALAKRTRSESVANSRMSMPLHMAFPSASEQHAHAMIAATSFHDGCFLGNALPSVVGDTSAIRCWDLDPWEYSMTQLVDFVVDMFDYYDLLHQFDISKATMRRFVVGVKNQYQDVPYHNFYHAFTTVHVSFMMVSSQSPKAPVANGTSLLAAHVNGSSPVGGASRDLFEVRDLMAILVAAYCHDMNHNGRTNDFHIRNRSDIAMLYNDQSVLENMHAAACFETMRRPGHDIFAHTTSSEFRHLRKSIIRAILATDMHSHAAIVSQLHDKLKREVFNPEDETHKELLVNAIVHAADISGPALPEALHYRWSSQLTLEFNMQYREEMASGLIPTPYMKAATDSAEMCKLNLAFIDSCVFPLWHIMDDFLDGLERCSANIQKNRAMWAAIMEDSLRDGEDGASSRDVARHWKSPPRRPLPLRPRTGT